jgi:hypothetical protein
MRMVQIAQNTQGGVLILSYWVLHYFVYLIGFNVTNNLESKGKGKAIPLQTLTGPEGSRRLRFLRF